MGETKNIISKKLKVESEKTSNRLNKLENRLLQVSTTTTGTNHTVYLESVFEKDNPKVVIDDHIHSITHEDVEYFMNVLYNFQCDSKEDIEKYFNDSKEERLQKILMSLEQGKLSDESFFNLLKINLEMSKLDKDIIPNLKDICVFILEAKQTNQQLRQFELEKLFIKSFAKNILISKFKDNYKTIKYNDLETLLNKLEKDKAPIYCKLLRDFEFQIPTLVDTKTKESSIKREEGKEYYNPYEIYLNAKDSGIFQDFVVLHYDYRKDAATRESAQTKKAKDPIIFGVLKGDIKFRSSFNNLKRVEKLIKEDYSLYDLNKDAELVFIVDWKDSYCDLDLDKFIKLCEQHKISTETLVNHKQDLKDSVNSYIKDLINETTNANLKNSITDVLNKYGVKCDSKESLCDKLKNLFS